MYNYLRVKIFNDLWHLRYFLKQAVLRINGSFEEDRYSNFVPVIHDPRRCNAVSYWGTWA